MEGPSSINLVLFTLSRLQIVRDGVLHKNDHSRLKENKKIQLSKVSNRLEYLLILNTDQYFGVLSVNLRNLFL